MEKVFWLMWLSDFVGSIGVVGWISSFGFVFGLVFLAIFSVACDEDGAEFFRKGWCYMRWLLIPIVCAMLVPNSSTIKLLAVAEATKMAADTALGSKALLAMDAVLDKIISTSKAK
jgi:hypothetical protein